MAGNVWSARLNKYYHSQLRTYLDVFPEVYVTAGARSGNRIFIGDTVKRAFGEGGLAAKGGRVGESLGLTFDLGAIAGRCQRVTGQRINSPLLTDDFAPVNVMRHQPATR